MTRPRLTLLGAEHPGPEGAGVTHQHHPLGAAGCPGRGRQELSLQLGGGPPQGGNSRHRELGCIESWDASRSPQVCSPRQDLPFPFNLRRRLRSLLEAAAPVCSHPLPTWLVPREGSSPGAGTLQIHQTHGPSPICISHGGPSRVHTRYSQAWGPPRNLIPVYLHFREII